MGIDATPDLRRLCQDKICRSTQIGHALGSSLTIYHIRTVSKWPDDSRTWGASNWQVMSMRLVKSREIFHKMKICKNGTLAWKTSKCSLKPFFTSSNLLFIQYFF